MATEWFSKREVFVKNERRSEGDYSIYIRSAGSQMSWYTGLTFSNKHACDKMVRTIKEMWLGATQ
jgi:hypothetical protein